MANLFLNDVFFTIQGEGRFAGTRALFVRMPHCNLRCSWCDTSFDSHKAWPEQDLMEFAAKEKARFAVVTGGEPTMHRHTPRVVELLQASGFYVAVETNGTFAPNAPFDWITCSPKRDAEYKVHPEMISKVNEFKYVVDNDFDFAILDRHAPDSAQALSLSPEHGGFAVNTAKIIDYIKEHPQWRLSLQTHKIIGVP